MQRTLTILAYFFLMDRGKSVGCQFLFNNMLFMLSDAGKVGVKNDYWDDCDRSEGDENSKAQLASACVACALVLCASACTF